jgi:suppressor for copper-sensitivity B
MFRDTRATLEEFKVWSIKKANLRLAKVRKHIAARVVAAAAMLLFAAVCAGFAASAQAQQALSSPWVANEHARLRLISAVDSTGHSETLPLGVEFRMAPQWKIYWRAPGDAGYPPTIDWSASTNVANIEIAWPVPQRYTIFGLTTYVYQDTVVLPLTVTPRQPGAPMALRGQVNYLLCDQICIPYEASLSLDLPAGEAKPTDLAQLIDRFDAKVPRKVTTPDGALGLKIERTLLTRAAAQSSSAPEDATLEVLVRSAVPFTKPDVLVEGPRQMMFGLPQVHLSEGNTLALLRVPVNLAGTQASLPTQPNLTLTLLDGGRAVEQAVMPDIGGTRTTSPILGILLLALLGGFILNFMPCVLPVLSIKLMSAVAQSGRSASQVRASFFATACGIVLSLVALGGMVIALKSAGMAVGWGVQFQQPVFLVVMALVVTLFAANLWGLFSISLPQVIGDTAGRARGEGVIGDFATGVFATLLATPCSAPFLGTAVGFALTRGTVEILAVFTTLGIGLALPYLAVTAVPRLARLLPKPGRWMVVLRVVLGIVLAATAIWLITVLRVQTGWAVALIVAVLLAAMVATLALWRRLAARSNSRSIAGAAVVALAVAVLAMPVVATRNPAQSTTASRHWQPFDRVQLFNAVAQGQLVLVDVTADWCITCQANKTLVLDRGTVRARIESGKVLALRADWTRPDAAIAEYLASFGRYGIPFNAVYGPGAPSGIALPELLREEDVLAALDKAAQSKSTGPKPTAARE